MRAAEHRPAAYLHSAAAPIRAVRERPRCPGARVQLVILRPPDRACVS
ncbi:hypothetical protein DB30_01030 [Enhygromyxa salina]|uniref:Uncharacterized protein n=1 Tax=Enhygromyxa salina TaxID=215803 RepID=A0A0C1Z584_9BACT|nr:hypothetical protein DB30_01030 [Enhygromyxa salina]